MVKTKTKSSSKSKRSSACEKQQSVPPKALPVTLLSGFLGSGKTTLLQHVLRSDHGLRIAVIVNDIGAINVDASLIRNTHKLTRTEEKVIALQNGCICCTLRGDLLEELVRLAELAEFDYIIIESSGISEPEQVAETFDQRLAEQMEALDDEAQEGLDMNMRAVLEKLKKHGGLEKFARLDTTVTVIDAFTMFHDFETVDLLSSRRDDVVPEDERTVSDLMVDQIEFADVIILNKIDTVDRATKERVLDLVSKLNHRAKVIESSYGRIDVNEIVNTGLFNLEVAQTGYGWLQDLHEMTLREVNGKKTVTPKPETEEYNVRNFVYTRRRPFNPRRLFELLHDKFILQNQFPEDEDDDDDMDLDSDTTDNEIMIDDCDLSTPTSPSSSSREESSSSSKTSVTTSIHDDTNECTLDIPDPSVVLANKRAHPIFARLFRSKGEFWMASRPNRAGDWSQAGAMLTLQGGRPWFACVDKSEWETGDAQIDALVQYDMQGKWGDRRQEIVFIGEALNVKAIEKLLDDCLLNDAEWADWESIMQDPKVGLEDKKKELVGVFEDGFPDWMDDEEDDENGADHHHHHDHHHSGGHDHGNHGVQHRITKDGVVVINH